MESRSTSFAFEWIMGCFNHTLECCKRC